MVGPRVYTSEQVQALPAQLHEIFGELERLKAEMRGLNIRVGALELIWGRAVREEGNPDHGEFRQHIEDLQAVKQRFEEQTARIEALGGQIKSLEPALVDFFGVRDGRLVFWCWTRGEERITHWHHVDEGFEQRQPIEHA